jgi:hypothetical protein
MQGNHYVVQMTRFVDSEGVEHVDVQPLAAAPRRFIHVEVLGGATLSEDERAHLMRLMCCQLNSQPPGISIDEVTRDLHLVNPYPDRVGVRARFDTTTQSSGSS